MPFCWRWLWLSQKEIALSKLSLPEYIFAGRHMDFFLQRDFCILLKKGKDFCLQPNSGKMSFHSMTFFWGLAWDPIKWYPNGTKIQKVKGGSAPLPTEYLTMPFCHLPPFRLEEVFSSVQDVFFFWQQRLFLPLQMCWGGFPTPPPQTISLRIITGLATAWFLCCFGSCWKMLILEFQKGVDWVKGMLKRNSFVFSIRSPPLWISFCLRVRGIPPRGCG